MAWLVGSPLAAGGRGDGGGVARTRTSELASAQRLGEGGAQPQGRLVGVAAGSAAAGWGSGGGDGGGGGRAHHNVRRLKAGCALP